MSIDPPALTRRDWLWFLAIWTIGVAAALLRLVNFGDGKPLFLDTDDAMRMVMVRDFLAGQNWYDLVQHRLNTPVGAEIHWSRLVDLPLAALLSLAGLVAAPAQALVLTGLAWPLLLLGALLFVSMRVARELVGPESLLPALVLPILSPAILAEFAPGRVDHHNVIILLTLACLWASLVALRRPLAAWLAGLAAASAMAVAIEAVPLVLATILAFGLAYVADPARAANLRRFGLGFALAMVGHLALARPPARWLEAACDMISPVYVLAGLAVGAAYLLVSLLPPPRRAVLRLALLGILGLAAAALVVAVYPQCLAGPYGALDPWLQDNWIAAINEARPFHVSFIESPPYAVVVGVPILLGLVTAAIALWRHPGQRLAWLILLVFLVCATLIMLAQVRGARLAILPTVPAAAWLIVVARRAYLARPVLLPALGLACSWLAFSGVILAMLVNGTLGVLQRAEVDAVAEMRSSKQSCLVSESYAGLAALPPARIMAPIDLGSHILLETPHEVVAAPYHRNEAGVLDTFRFFNRPADEARAIARERGLGLVVTCDAMPEMQGSGLDDPGTTLNLLAAGTPPDWFDIVSLDGALKIYAIRP
ncbi:MAG: hypothetical protein ABS75_30780 [Pelagibacterium sp. SCN 63-23]|nr:MAG: hypothetical protein ABS75_30780 [Pelagibacterium sp. SCN 63-23]